MGRTGGNVTIRVATAGDVARIGEIMHGDPGAESVGLVGGDARLAAAFGKGLLALERIPNPDRPTVVAERDGEVVGVLQYTLGVADEGVTLERVRLALRLGGPVRIVRSLPRLRARQRVDFDVPRDAFHLAEIHVDPRYRGEGIGGQLLDWADAEAGRLGRDRLVLTTHMRNPARRLYERKGYAVVGERTDPRYEHYTGIPGRLLMEKTLG